MVPLANRTYAITPNDKGFRFHVAVDQGGNMAAAGRKPKPSGDYPRPRANLTPYLILSTNRLWLEGFGMKRYFFHIAGPRGMFIDDNGRRFLDLKGANAHAARVASELAQDPKYVGSSVCIVDEWGRELDRVSIGSGWSKS
jgi:hypothetical protein